jgi:hypothetical protein
MNKLLVICLIALSLINFNEAQNLDVSAYFEQAEQSLLAETAVTLSAVKKPSRRHESCKNDILTSLIILVLLLILFSI